MILVVGATGEVGFGVVRELRASALDVAALVRPATDASAVEAIGALVRRGDLLDHDSLRAAVAGVDVIVATANAIVPRRGERPDFAAIWRGYEALGRLAVEQGVRRMIVLSVPTTFVGRGAIEFDVRARSEERLRRDGPPLTVARASLFMESWLPAVGSRIPVRGDERATVNRGFWLARFAGATTQNTIDRFGVALIPAHGRARHSFIAADDVAGSLAAVAGDPDGQPDELRLGGPQALDWHDVVDAYERVLGRRLRRVRQPVAPYGALSALSRRLSEPAAHLMAVQRLVGLVDSDYAPDDSRRLLGRDPVSVQEFLASRNG